MADLKPKEVISADLVSILMPVRNEAVFLEAALNSVNPPAGLECEVIVIDDGSTDGTGQIAVDFAARAPWPSRILSSAGAGKTAALNLGFSIARGDRFLLLAGDDLLVSDSLPDRLAAVSGPGPKLAQCRYRTFYGDQPGAAGVEYPRSSQHDHLAGGAVSFNRDLATIYFPIPEQLANEDTWLRAVVIAFGICPVFVDRLGLHYRIHPGNSVGPLRSFAQTDQNLRLRHSAFALAAERFAGTATQAGLARLELLARAEKLRAGRHWIALLLLPGLRRQDRLTMLANATPWLYFLKNRLPRLLRRPRS